MSPSSSGASGDERIEQAAAEWILRQDRGLTAAEQDGFSDWLAADPRHRASWERHRRNWERLDSLVQWRPEHAGSPNRDLLAPRPAVAGWSVTSRRAWWLAAGSLAAAVAAVFFFGHRRLGSAEVVLTGPSAAPIEAHHLEDGSVVELNRGAELAVVFSAAERHVRLERGEAHFTVAKNPARPFIVSAAGVDVRAVGTQFDVRFDADELDVVVTEGRVKVGSIPLVQAGERAVISLVSGGPAPRVETISAARSDQLLGWRPQELDFNGAPLAEFVAGFNRCNSVQLVIADPALAEIKLSARLRSDNIDGFVRLLERGFDIKAERVGNQILLRKAP